MPAVVDELRTALGSLGIGLPRRLRVRDSAEAARADLTQLPGERVVVKVVSPEIPHKSDVGGVRIVPRRAEAVAECVRDMERRLASLHLDGFSLDEWIDHDHSPGGELIVGVRSSEEFGPLVTLGLGGIHAERLAAALKDGRALVVLSPHLDRERRFAALQSKLVATLLMQPLRGAAPRLSAGALSQLLDRLLDFAAACVPHEITELEINPLVIAERGFVALDLLVRVGEPKAAPVPPRPLEKLDRLLRPETLALVGVSEHMNPGRIILRNTLRRGFPPERIFVVKPGTEAVDGCRCYPDVGALPGRVDLCVLSVAASSVPEIFEAILDGRKAESVIVIPGGIGERGGTEPLAHRVRCALDTARATDWRGPLVNGGNCLGIRSRPGRYDTMFIPEEKYPSPQGPAAPLAFLSQSGAFALAQTSKLPELDPRYVISLGNQLDLTVGDYLAQLAHDRAIEVFACYVEGFRPLDGLLWLEAVQRIAADGRTVILYRAARTAAGSRASASHTASMAGDWVVTRELAEQAGAIVAGTLDDFHDLVRVACRLRGRPVRGWGLGAVSNAGFECVAIADNLRGFELPAFDAVTTERVLTSFSRRRIERIVEVHNPVDTTPILDD